MHKIKALISTFIPKKHHVKILTNIKKNDNIIIVKETICQQYFINGGQR